MAYTFEQVLAVDPSNPANVARAASITIFAPGDAAKTPLTLTDTNGSPLPNPLTVNANGFGPAFMHDTLDRVAWEGGGFTGFLTSYEGMKQEAIDARTAAETAAATAGADAAAVADAAIGDATAEAEAAAASAAAAEAAAASSATAAANSAALVNAPADTAIAAAINGSGTATKTALNATIATETEPLQEGLAGLQRTQISRGGVAALGDSITAWGSASQSQHGDVWWNLLGIKTNQRIRFDAFYATAGHTMEQIETDHLPSVLAMDPKPGACFIFAGTNNVGAGFNITTLAATHQRITDALIGAGIVPVLCTIPPRNNPTSAVQQVAQWNAFIRGKASQNGFPLLDVNAALIDPATGGFLAGLGETDAIHPNYKGHAAIANLGAASSALVNRFPDGAPYLARSISDAANIFGDSGMFQVDTNADGIADGWTGSGIPASATASIVTDAEGKWQRLSKTSGQTGTGYIWKDIIAGTSWAVGDRFQFAARVRANNDSGTGGTPILQAIMMGASKTFDSRTLSATDGIAYVSGTIPAGTTSIRIQCMLVGTAAAAVNADFKQVTFANLTKLGL